MQACAAMRTLIPSNMKIRPVRDILEVVDCENDLEGCEMIGLKALLCLRTGIVEYRPVQ